MGRHSEQVVFISKNGFELADGARPRGGDLGCSVIQEGSERSNDVADKLRELMKRWEQRITVSDLHLDDRFIRGEIHILLIVGRVPHP